MNFCPLCLNLLMVEQSAKAVRLICYGCKYYYPRSEFLYSEAKSIVGSPIPGYFSI